MYHLPDWHKLSHPQRLTIIRQIAMMRGRDPRIAKLCHRILMKNKVKPREYEKQAEALLKWVQDPNNVYYLNEPGERLQDPIHTLKVGHADCDDQVLLLCAMFESIALPWRLVLSGRDQANNQKVRYIEGEAAPYGVKWSHIYCMVGCPPGRGMRWYFCEPTIDGVPLGWDVINGDHRFLPEMRKTEPGAKPTIFLAPKYSSAHKKGAMPAAVNRSPAYAESYGSAGMVGGVTSAAMTLDGDDSPGIDWGTVGQAVFVGVAVSIATDLTLDFVKGRGLWETSGDVVTRIKRLFTKAA